LFIFLNTDIPLHNYIYYIYIFFVVGVEVVSINAIAKEPNGVVIGITLIRVSICVIPYYSSWWLSI